MQDIQKMTEVVWVQEIIPELLKLHISNSIYSMTCCLLKLTITIPLSFFLTIFATMDFFPQYCKICSSCRQCFSLIIKKIIFYLWIKKYYFQPKTYASMVHVPTIVILVTPSVDDQIRQKAAWQHFYLQIPSRAGNLGRTLGDVPIIKEGKPVSRQIQDIVIPYENVRYTETPKDQLIQWIHQYQISLLVSRF